MDVINVQEAKTHFSRFLERASAGEVILIGKYGKPTAKLTAYAPQSELRLLGGMEGEITFSSDFDEEDSRIELLFHGFKHELPA